MINYILLVIYIWVSGWVVAVYICIYILLYIHTYTLFFFNLIVKSIETFVVCAVSRIKLLLLLLLLLVKRTKMIVLHVRHPFLNNSLPYSSKLLREMTNFKVLTTTWTNYTESFSLTLYFKSVLTNPVTGRTLRSY